MEAVLSVVKTGLKLYRESWPIVFSRVRCAVGNKKNFSFPWILVITDYVFKRRATGGSIANILPRLSDAELNVTQSIGNDGNVSSSSINFFLYIIGS
jgi:hypothetical protein